MEELFSSDTACMQDGDHDSKSKKLLSTSSKIKPASDIGEVPGKSKVSKGKGEKRTKKRKGSDSSKKPRKEDIAEGKSNSTSRHSSATPDSEPRQEQVDSPITDDVFEGSNSSQESSEMLSMSSLLKSVLDQKKKLLLESDEVQQFLMQRAVKQEPWEGVSN